MTFGEKLQKLRKARGWTQEELAQQAGVSRQSLSKWESDAALPDTANVVALSDLFGVSTDYLLREAASGTTEATPVPAAPAAPSKRMDLEIFQTDFDAVFAGKAALTPQ